MSTFLGYEDGTIALGQTPTQMKDTIRGLFTTYGWQVVREQIPGSVLNNTTANQDDDTSTAPSAMTMGSSGWVGFCADTAFVPTQMYLLAPYAVLKTCPKDFVLEYSDNGTDWSQQQAWTNADAKVKGELLRFSITAAGSHRWWRFRPTAVVSGTAFECPLWYLENASGWRTHPSIFFDMVPPSGETIGNSTAREIVRFYFGNSSIALVCLQELLIDEPYLTAFSSPAAGAVTLSVTIGGVTVSYAGSAGDSATKNGKKLFEALKDSVDSNFTAWDWYWLNGIIFAKNKTFGASPGAITCSNITNNQLAKSCPASVQASGYNPTYTLNADLADGFIYFLQVNSRGFALATKINTGFSGPVHVCYASNSFALGAVPASNNTFFIKKTLTEVVYGIDDTGTAYSDSNASVTHWFGIRNAIRTTSENPDYNGYSYGGDGNRWTFEGHNLDAYDVAGSPAFPGYLYSEKIRMEGEGFILSTGQSTGYPLHRLRAFPKNYTVQSSTGYLFAFHPGNDAEDWYRYAGSLVDEQLILAPHPDATTTVSANVDAATTTIQATSTTEFPSSGHVVIDGECIYYASKTASAFTNCTRGDKGTVATKHYVGDKVYVGGWFVKINQGLLFAGFADPT